MIPHVLQPERPAGRAQLFSACLAHEQSELLTRLQVATQLVPVADLVDIHIEALGDGVQRVTGTHGVGHTARIAISAGASGLQYQGFTNSQAVATEVVVALDAVDRGAVGAGNGPEVVAGLDAVAQRVGASQGAGSRRRPVAAASAFDPRAAGCH